MPLPLKKDNTDWGNTGVGVGHYENFPVASILVPPVLRQATITIYRFARGADDIADEGDSTAEERLETLQAWQQQLQRLRDNNPLLEEPAKDLFLALDHTIKKHHLPFDPFFDLLDAFSQDVRQLRYPTYTELLDYCRRSANPVGRLMLSLYQANTAQNIRYSDAICSSLQLINFWQDVAIDWKKRRIYLPQDSMQKYRVSEEDIAEARNTKAWQELMAFEVNRARQLMQSGIPLVGALPGRLRWEISLVIQGGLRILEKIESVHYDVFRLRPTLSSMDWVLLVWRVCRPLPT